MTSIEVENLFLSSLISDMFIFFFFSFKSFCLQTISYMAERVVGHGSFGVVFQVRI